MSAYLSLFVCVIGAVVFYVTTHADTKALAKDCFWVGLLVFLFQVGTQQISLLR